MFFESLGYVWVECKQQIAAHRIETCPDGRIYLPFGTIDAVGFLAPFTIETDGLCTNIL